MDRKPSSSRDWAIWFGPMIVVFAIACYALPRMQEWMMRK